MEELRETKGTALELVDKNIANLTDVPGVCEFRLRFDFCQKFDLI